MGSKESVSSDSNNDLEEAVFSYDDNQVEEENKILKQTVTQLRAEINKYRSPALMVAEVVDYFDSEKAIIKVSNGNKFLVQTSSGVGDLEPGEPVLVEQKNLTVVDKIDADRKYNVEKFVIVENPDISWDHVGGLEDQVKEVREVVELPLGNPDKFKKVGIEPPKGILLHGPPGTGKTLLAKAVASSTNSTFIEIVGSELVQKFIGEGAKFVKEVFDLAREKSPSIIFIDEIDALAARRVEIGTSGEREVQRTFMQLLAEIDGFDPLGDVKVIGCTNRADVLDPAILRPGRFDRQIEVPHPDNEGVREIFDIHSKNMEICDCDEERIHSMLKGLSGAEIKAVCTEAGYFAIRNDRHEVTEKDIHSAIKKVRREEDQDKTYLQMFG